MKLINLLHKSWSPSERSKTYFRYQHAWVGYPDFKLLKEENSFICEITDYYEYSFEKGAYRPDGKPPNLDCIHPFMAWLRHTKSGRSFISDLHLPYGDEFAADSLVKVWPNFRNRNRRFWTSLAPNVHISSKNICAVVVSLHGESPLNCIFSITPAVAGE